MTDPFSQLPDPGGRSLWRAFEWDPGFAAEVEVIWEQLDERLQQPFIEELAEIVGNYARPAAAVLPALDAVARRVRPPSDDG